MYEAFYELKEKPFNLHPDSEYLYMSSGHENAYNHMLYAISENKGFVVITGEIGSGKTTLINYLLKNISQLIQIGLINNTYLSPDQFIKTLCKEFEIEVEGYDKTVMIEKFHTFLIDQYIAKKRVILIVDESQNLTLRTLEEIRMLSNLEMEKSHLMQIVLVGQPELKYKLQRSELQQFTQRVTVHCHLNSLDKKEVSTYIEYRLGIAGAKNDQLFGEDAIAAISKYSGGIPRLINILCDTALVYGFADARETIDAAVIEDVIRERAMGGIFPPDAAEKGHSSFAGPNPVYGSSYEGGTAGRFLERLKLLESKVERIESSLHNHQGRLKIIESKKDQKDAIVLELFKLLKESMENRFRTLLHFTDFQKRQLHK